MEWDQAAIYALIDTANIQSRRKAVAEHWSWFSKKESR